MRTERVIFEEDEVVMARRPKSRGNDLNQREPDDHPLSLESRHTMAHTISQLTRTSDQETVQVISDDNKPITMETIRHYGQGKLILAAHKEAELYSSEWREGNIGHSWLMIHFENGVRLSMGFWPNGLDKPWKTVRGSVNNPDLAHQGKATALYSVQVTGEQVIRGIAYMQANKSRDYNLLLYNCTTFAREMFKAITGSDAPRGGLLFDDPADLSDAIIAEAEAER
jgi:hypothetical protein